MESDKSKHDFRRAAAALCDAVGVPPDAPGREQLEALAWVLVLQVAVARSELRLRPRQ